MLNKLTLEHIYNHLQQGPIPSTELEWNWIWRLNVSPEGQAWVWKLWHRVVPVRALLRARGLTVHDACRRCRSAEESLGHLIWEYPKSQRCCKLTWRLLEIDSPTLGDDATER